MSGGQCHLTHLAILGRFSWPNLACMCTEGHKARFISFGYLLKGDRSVLMKRLASDSENVPKPNVLLVDHIKHFVDYMYGERQE